MRLTFFFIIDQKISFSKLIDVANFKQFIEEY
jgi:hypothetical protein